MLLQVEKMFLEDLQFNQELAQMCTMEMQPSKAALKTWKMILIGNLSHAIW